MVVTPLNSDTPIKNVLLNGETLDRVYNYNYVGVKIDDKLSFDAFLKEKCNRVNMRIYQL